MSAAITREERERLRDIYAANGHGSAGRDVLRLLSALSAKEEELARRAVYEEALEAVYLEMRHAARCVDATGRDELLADAIGIARRALHPDKGGMSETTLVVDAACKIVCRDDMTEAECVEHRVRFSPHDAGKDGCPVALAYKFATGMLSDERLNSMATVVRAMAAVRCGQPKDLPPRDGSLPDTTTKANGAKVAGEVGSTPAGGAAWSCYTKSGPSHRSTTRADVTHGTLDGGRTLCGAAVFGDMREIPFDVDSAQSCRRCVASLRRGGRR